MGDLGSQCSRAEDAGATQRPERAVGKILTPVFRTSVSGLVRSYVRMSACSTRWRSSCYVVLLLMVGRALESGRSHLRPAFLPVSGPRDEFPSCFAACGRCRSALLGRAGL